MAEEKKQRRYSYRAVAAKGADFLSDPKLNRQEEYIIDPNGERKPSSSNVPVIVLDTGNAHVPGKCYDHHQLSQEAKLKYPSATSMVYAARKEIYEAHKDDEAIQFICHQNPDNDAILSIALASILMDYEGKTPLVAQELVEWANKSDTYNYDLGFNFGSFLDFYTKALTPTRQHSTPNLQREAVERSVNLVREIVGIYNDMKTREKDPEKKAKITLNSVVDKISEPGNDYSSYIFKKYFVDMNGRKLINFRKGQKTIDNPKAIKSYLNENKQLAENTYKSILKYDRIPIKNADEKREIGKGFGSGVLGYDTFETNLCKRQITKEEQQLPLEKSDKKIKAFIYTGTKKCPADISLLAKNEFDVIIIPNYNEDTDTITYKISTSREDLDLGHFGKYIETMIYRENLDQKDSKIKDKKEFEDNKKKFIERRRPLNEDMSKKHFTSYDSICGNDPTFFGFTVNKNSNLYSLQTFKDYMLDYFDNPEKIRRKDFINLIGEDHFDELEAVHRPEVLEEKKHQKDLEIANVTDDVISAIAESPLEGQELDEAANEIVDINIRRQEEIEVDDQPTL